MEISIHLAQGWKRRFGWRRRGGGGAREASRHDRGRHCLLAGPPRKGSHEIRAPPAGVLRGRGGGQEEHESRDSGAGGDYAAPGEELARRRRMRRIGVVVVRHCLGCGRWRSSTDGGAWRRVVRAAVAVDCTTTVTSARRVSGTRPDSGGYELTVLPSVPQGQGQFPHIWSGLVLFFVCKMFKFWVL